MAIAETTIANKVRYDADEALALARQAAEGWAAKGKKITRLRLAYPATTDELLLAHLLGPSGKLRAPAIRIGEVLVIGFDPGLVDEALGAG